MAEKDPVAILAFANPHHIPEEYLPKLQREADTLYSRLNLLDMKNICDVVILQNSSTPVIFDTTENCSLEKDVILFHYGGHASERFLKLTREDGTSKLIDHTGIAGLLGKQPNLKLVFLNGCSTREQVQTLFDHGVKAVIATSTSVNDEMASGFAIRFYKNLSQGRTIRESFELAKDYIAGEFHYHEVTFSCRGFETDDDDEDFFFPYGLYVKDGFEEILNWKFPHSSPALTGKFLPEAHVYNCDRTYQNGQFLEAIQQQKESSVRFFTIHGHLRQSHYGLVKRFSIRHLKQAVDPSSFDEIIIPLDTCHNEKRHKLILSSEILHKFRIETHHLAQEEMTGAFLAEKLKNRGIKNVSINLKLYSTRWRKYLPKVMDWLATDFFDQEKLPEGSPDFYIFFQVLYDRAPNWIVKPVWGNIQKTILSAIRKSQKFFLLDELKKVTTEDLKNWFEFTEIAVREKEKDEYLIRYFGKNKGRFDMEDVEEKLEKIIKDYNKNQA